MIKQINDIDQLIHDMNNILFSISGMILLGKTEEAKFKLEQIFGEFECNDKNFSPINCLINAKIKLARKYKINFHIDKNVLFPPVDDSELCIIFGNILDNAIESCVNLSLYNKFIRFEFINSKNKYIYIISNSKSIFRTSKNKDSCHMGLRITNKLINKNRGLLDISENKEIFNTLIVFPKDIDVYKEIV